MTGSEESGDGYGKGSHESIVDHGGRNICRTPDSHLRPLPLEKRWVYATEIEAARNTGHVAASTRTNPSPDKDRRGNNGLENYFDVEGRRSAS